ncbi:PLP-dependent aminotransferase family protein [Curvibacter sp. HBC61]|uniref:PLP-dependent aminotransferase family protein n=1 Tax=Curvibacter cyanobacteriorum TaxID=3026422 RepID=A0ABT5N450_9BURK|nr:PLP-dependent aminotransferase family protein [Curvibacter sp. HBC61]MDD0841099.1 PLP-dependent aminotransferase family protein [Curvibacter sp. HBC61]
MGQFEHPNPAPAAPAPTGPGRRLYELLRSQITDGGLPAGARAPSTRALAAEWGVSRTTVTAVYEQLAAEGYLHTSAGRVARVASLSVAAGARRTEAAVPRAAGAAPPAGMAVPGITPMAAGPGPSGPRLSDWGRRVQAMALSSLPASEPLPFDFLYGALAPQDFPVLAWRRASKLAALQPPARLSYAAPEGDPALRRALQGYLRRARGLVCDAEQMLLVQGSQQGIDLCARLLLQAGDRFAFEDPGYLMARRCFEATGAHGTAVPVDAQGLDPAQLPQGRPVRLLYVTPSHQFPLGGVLPVTRRQAVLDWAQRQQAWVVEDDYDGEFRYGQRPMDALQSMDPDGRVIYVGTFSKALSPQLRLGYLVLPAALVPVFRQAKRLSDRHAPVEAQRVLATLIDSGAYERHVRRVRRDNERRRAALLAALARELPQSAEVTGAAAGLHLVLWLPLWRAADEPGLAAAARAVGVGLYPVSPLYASGLEGAGATHRPAGFILGYASLTVAQIEEGVRRLGALLRARGGARGAVV